MKKHLFFVLIFLIACQNFKAQPFLEWANSCGSSDEEVSQSIAIDQLGYVYTIGQYNSTTDFDPGPATYTLPGSGFLSTYIQKLDGLGHLVWAKNISGNNKVWGYSIALDGSDNIYIAGFFDNIADFDPGAGTYTLGVNSTRSCFIEKLDNGGNLIWAKSIANADGSSLTVDAAGNSFITGHYSNGSADFDPGAGVYNLAANNSIFILKLNSTGDFVFAKGFGNLGCNPYSVKLDHIGNILITGNFENTVDFDPGPGVFPLTATQFHYDIFILKLNASADLIWAKGMGSDWHSGGIAISSDNSNNILITGYFSHTVDFDPGPGTFTLATISSLEWDVFVLKLDATGNFVWVKGIGSHSDDAGYAIFCDAADNIYTGGSFRGNVDFDPGPSNLILNSGSVSSSFIQKLSPSGNLIWATSLYGYKNACLSLVVNSSQDVYAAGNFENSIHLDPPFGSTYLTASGGNDVYVVKLTANNTIGLKENSSPFNIQVSPNPTKDKITISVSENINEVQLTVINIAGLELINERIFSLKTETLDISNLAPGIYFLKLSSQKQNSVTKIIKN